MLNAKLITINSFNKVYKGISAHKWSLGHTTIFGITWHRDFLKKIGQNLIALAISGHLNKISPDPNVSEAGPAWGLFRGPSSQSQEDMESYGLFFFSVKLIFLWKLSYTIQ